MSCVIIDGHRYPCSVREEERVHGIARDVPWVEVETILVVRIPFDSIDLKDEWVWVGSSVEAEMDWPCTPPRGMEQPLRMVASDCRLQWPDGPGGIELRHSWRRLEWEDYETMPGGKGEVL